MLYYIGIDPGISGAITLLDFKGNYVKTIPMPMVKLDGKSAYKQWYDIETIIELFKEYQGSVVALEYQRPIIDRYGKKASAGGQGSVAIFRTGRGFGLLEGLVNVFFNNITIVDPNRWQNFLLKKYLTKDEIQILKAKKVDYKQLIDNIKHDKYREWYTKHVTKKSTSKAKKKTAYIFYKVFESYNFDIDIKWKNNNYVDSFLIAKYMFDQQV
jgi:crossover junction endodeoxyribonuclease RuvC